MLPPKTRRLISLHYTSLNKSKNCDRYFSIIGTDHCNSKLCENFQFEKDIHLYFSIFQKICRKIQVRRSYFGKTASFLSLEFIDVGRKRKLQPQQWIPLSCRSKKLCSFLPKYFPYQETRRITGLRVSMSIIPMLSVMQALIGGWVNLCDTKKINLKNQFLIFGKAQIFLTL